MRARTHTYQDMKHPIRKSYIGEYRPVPVFTVIGDEKRILTSELVVQEYEIGDTWGMGRVVKCAESGNRFRPYRITVEIMGHDTKSYRSYAEAKAAR